MKQLRGRTAVVTGAASGIGRAVALALGDRGCRLVLADIDEQGMADTARQLESRGAEVITAIVNVAERAAVEALAERVDKELGGAQILGNNAGVTVDGGFAEQTWDDWDWIMGINLWGVIYGCRAFLPQLLGANEAHIVNLSSMFGLAGFPAQVSYCTTKYAVRGFSEALYQELRYTPVGLTLVHPGGVKTNIVHAARVRHDDAHQRFIEYFEKQAMPPEQAAARIVTAIERGTPRLCIAKETYLADWLKRIAPVWGNDVIVNLLIRMLGMKGELKRRSEELVNRFS